MPRIPDVKESPEAEFVRALREEMQRILDELGTAHAQDAAGLKARFESAWRERSDDAGDEPAVA